MTKQEYWAVYVGRNSNLANPEHEIRIKAGALKRWLEDAYDKGQSHDQLDGLLDLLLSLYRYGPKLDCPVKQ